MFSGTNYKIYTEDLLYVSLPEGAKFIKADFQLHAIHRRVVINFRFIYTDVRFKYVLFSKYNNK